MVENAEIGSILKFIRNQKGMSLSQIKEKTGLAKSSLSSIENNKSNPTTKNLAKICDALEISVDFLFYFQKEINSYIKSNNIFSMNHELIHALFDKFHSVYCINKCYIFSLGFFIFLKFIKQCMD